MIFRVQRSGVSASGMSHLSLIRPLLTNTPNFAVGTIPKMSRCSGTNVGCTKSSKMNGERGVAL